MGSRRMAHTSVWFVASQQTHDTSKELRKHILQQHRTIGDLKEVSENIRSVMFRILSLFHRSKLCIMISLLKQRKIHVFVGEWRWVHQYDAQNRHWVQERRPNVYLSNMQRPKDGSLCNAGSSVHKAPNCHTFNQSKKMFCFIQCFLLENALLWKNVVMA